MQNIREKIMWDKNCTVCLNKQSKMVRYIANWVFKFYVPKGHYVYPFIGNILWHNKLSNDIYQKKKDKSITYTKQNVKRNHTCTKQIIHFESIVRYTHVFVMLLVFYNLGRYNFPSFVMLLHIYCSIPNVHS